jgi:hypothetical protein
VRQQRQEPRNVCGIPWNWSRIHHRGKSILDMAGQSFSCGLSDPKSALGAPRSEAATSSGSCGGHVLLIPLSHLPFPAGTMALSSSPQRIALAVAFFGLPAFILGVVAENKKVQPFL